MRCAFLSLALAAVASTGVTAAPQSTLRLPAAPPQSTLTVSAGQSYPEARRQAIALNRPLIVWVGGNFCPACIAGDELAGDFVHCFTDRFPGVTGPATVAALPSDGQLLWVSSLWKWDDGHLGTVRGTLRAFRRDGTTVDEFAPAASAYQRFRTAPPQQLRAAARRGG